MTLRFFRPQTDRPCALPYFETPVKAGFPSPTGDYMEQRLDLNEHLIQHPAATFFVRVDGDSMKGAGIHHGDILIIDRALEPSSGKIVVAVVNGEFTVKRIRLVEGEIWLEPENPNYPPVKINPAWEFQIWGVVTYVIHKAC